jgi:hypothetical protein
MSTAAVRIGSTPNPVVSLCNETAGPVDLGQQHYESLIAAVGQDCSAFCIRLVLAHRGTSHAIRSLLRGLRHRHGLNLGSAT